MNKINIVIMADIVKFKYGTSIEGKSVEDGDFVAINKGMSDPSESDNSKYGSMYRGSKIVGTTEANKLFTTEELTVTGVTVGNFANGQTISKGTDVMSLLKQMLMKEIDVSAVLPKVTLSNSGTAKGTYEVGTSINVTLSHNYTDGYFKGNEGYDYRLNAGCSEGETQYKRGSSSLSGNTDTQVLTEGTITYTSTTTYGASTAKPVTNFGNTSSVSIKSGAVTNTSASNVTFTGAYKYFMGYSTNTTVEQFNSESIRALTTKTENITKDGTTTIVSSSAITSNGTSIVIACPTKYKLATIQNGLGANILDNFSVKGTVSVTTGTVSTDYSVYIYPITNGAEVEFKNVTLNKA